MCVFVVVFSLCVCFSVSVVQCFLVCVCVCCDGGTNEHAGDLAQNAAPGCITSTGATRHSLKRHDPGVMPDCPKYASNVPAGWIQTPGGRDMQAGDDWGLADTVDGAGYVATDGGSKGIQMCNRASWGVFWGTDVPHNAKGAAPRKRAGADAVAQFLAMSQTQVTVIIDEKGIVRQLRGVYLGRNVERVRGASWGQVERRIHRFRAVQWVKAHLGADMADTAAILGVPPAMARTQCWVGCFGDRRDHMHTYDPGLFAKYNCVLHTVRMHWIYLLQVHAKVRTLTQQRVTEWVTERTRLQTAKNRPRKDRTDEDWARQHQIVNWRGHKVAHTAAAPHAKGKGKHD